MDENNIEKKIHNFLWGNEIVVVNDKDGNELTCLINPLSSSDKNLSDFIYSRELARAKEEDMLSEKEIIDLARERDEWPEGNDNYYDKEKFDELMLYAKQQLDTAPSRVHKMRIEKQIKNAEKTRQEVISKYNELVHHSAEARAREAQIIHVVSKCATDLGGNLIFPGGLSDIKDQILLWNLVQVYIKIQNNVDQSEIRKIARSSQWRFRWSACKNNPSLLFKRDLRDLSDKQLLLIYWSQVYDGVYQSLECPDEEVINDDKLLDKWLEDQSAKQKEERKKRVSNFRTMKQDGFYDYKGNFHPRGRSVSDHHELGVSVEGEYDRKTGIWRQYTKEEREQKIREIYSRNTSSTRQVLARQQDRIEKEKLIKEQHLRNKRDIMILGSPTNVEKDRRR